jgi:hypothetical protein
MNYPKIIRKKDGKEITAFKKKARYRFQADSEVMPRPQNPSSHHHHHPDVGTADPEKGGFSRAS